MLARNLVEIERMQHEEAEDHGMFQGNVARLLVTKEMGYQLFQVFS